MQETYQRIASEKSLLVQKILAGMGVLLFLSGLILLWGCGPAENKRICELEGRILTSEVLPEELRKIINERKEDPFQFTYTDEEKLYICIGYGKQEGLGYSIILNDLYLSENGIHVDTTLVGNDTEKQSMGQAPKKKAACPFIVIQTEKSQQPVLFD